MAESKPETYALGLTAWQLAVLKTALEKDVEDSLATAAKLEANPEDAARFAGVLRGLRDLAAEKTEIVAEIRKVEAAYGHYRILDAPLDVTLEKADVDAIVERGGEIPLHDAAELVGGRIPAHVPGAYPRLSCCGGPVKLVPAEPREEHSAPFVEAPEADTPLGLEDDLAGAALDA